MLEKQNPVRTGAWNDLRTHHHKVMRLVQMKDLFREDPARFQKYCLWLEDILLDYSKNIITDETLFLLTELARETGVSDAMEKMFSGDLINETENQAVLHTALRNRANAPVYLDGKDIMPEVNSVLSQMEAFSTKVSSGQWLGYTGRPVTDPTEQAQQERRRGQKPGHLETTCHQQVIHHAPSIQCQTRPSPQS